MIIKKYTGATGDGDAGSILIAKGGKTHYGSGIKKILVTNSHTTNTTRFRLYIDVGSNEYDLALTDIPALTSLVLEDNLTYSSNTYDLKVNLSEAGYNITIIIK